MMVNNKDDKNIDYSKRNKDRLQRNLKLVEEPDSIVVIPFAKPNRFALTKMCIELDRILGSIKRRVGFQMDYDTGKLLINKINEFSDSVWQVMIKAVPSLYSKTKEQWRQINNPIDHKRILVHRNLCFVILPRSEEIGQITMAVKVIEKAGLALRVEQTSYDALKEATEEYCNLMQDFDLLLTRIASEAGIEYVSPLNVGKNEPAPDKVKKAPATAKKKTGT